jgi:pilus assembly protein CpaE
MRTERRPIHEAPDIARGGGAEGRGAGRRAQLLAFVTDEESEAALRGGLNLPPGQLQVRRGDAMVAAAMLEREPAPETLLVDISGLSDPVGALEALAHVCTPDVGVIVIGERTDIGFYRQLTRDLMIAEYLAKPITRDLAARLVAPHLLRDAGQVAAARRSGQVVAVCGVRGGCGATTVAVNLALQMADVARGHVALLDLHLRGGTAGLMLGVQASTGLRVALEDPERVDSLFLDRVVIPIEERLRLIAADEPLESAPAPTEEGVRRLVEMLQQRFNQVVIDMPMPPGKAERAALDMARHVVLVMSPDVPGIRDAIAARKLLPAEGALRAMTVLNRAGLPGGLTLKLVEQGLGAAPDLVIPDLPQLLPRAANLGQPALRQSVQLRRALAPLTREITAVRAPAEGAGSWLARLLARWRAA